MYKINEVIDMTIETRNELLEVKKMLEKEIPTWCVADSIYKKIVKVVNNAIKRELIASLKE